MEKVDIDKSEFLCKYVDEMVLAMHRMYPDMSTKDIEKLVRKKVEKNLTNPEVTMDNNFIHETKKASLLSVVDWTYKRKPIIAGNGTFYKNQEEALNPTADMLEGMGAKRKSLKKEMFKFNESSLEYLSLDLGQANQKINMNSYYGASGLPVSAFYSQWSGPATTLTAQSVISTTETAFEGFLADNYLFTSFDEFIDWSKCVLEEEQDLDDFVQLISEEQLVQRLISKFWKYDESYEELIRKFVSSLTITERTRMYFKNNIREFTKMHPEIQALYYNVYSKIRNIPYAKSVDDIDPDTFKEFEEAVPYYNKEKTVKEFNNWVNKERFLNPNEVPKSIKDDLKQLSDYYLKYCYVRYLVPDRIHRLKYFKRRAVVIVDTDSNMLNCQPWVKFLERNVTNGESFGRDKNGNMFVGVNSIAYILTNMVTDILLWYGKKSNIPEKYRPKFNMKNEFLFIRLFIAKKKKRYLSSIILREGNLYDPVRIDEKGLDYKRSGTSESCEDYYRSLTVKYLLDTPEIDVRGMKDELMEFRDKIKESLYNGEKTYLPNASAKEIGAYKNPWSIQTFRGVYAWDALYPGNQVSIPCKLNIVKLNIYSEKDIEPLKKTNPEIYERIMKYIFRSNNPEVVKNGLKVLAIPNNVSKMPEWTRDYIDYTTMVSDILAPFKCVMDLVKFKQMDVGKTSTRKSKVFTNIIQF